MLKVLCFFSWIPLLEIKMRSRSCAEKRKAPLLRRKFTTFNQDMRIRACVFTICKKHILLSNYRKNIEFLCSNYILSYLLAKSNKSAQKSENNTQKRSAFFALPFRCFYSSLLFGAVSVFLSCLLNKSFRTTSYSSCLL